MLKHYYDYVEHRDPHARAGNVIAMFILSNQPFYPLYLYLLLGGRFWPALLTLLSSPFYAAVPWLMRRNVTAGKGMLVLASIGNTIVATRALGQASGLELFFFPCVVLGALLFASNESVARWTSAIVPIALFLLLRSHYGAPLENYSAAEYGTMLTLHAVSAAAICIFICFSLGGVRRGD